MKAIVYITVLIGVAALSLTANAGVVHRYVEDFSSTRYRDAAFSTAWWDTVAGEIKLHPFAAKKVGWYPTGAAADVGLNGRTAFIADQSAGVMSFDVTDPTFPVLLAVRSTPGWANDISVEGFKAYVADGSGGLLVLDIHDPAFPVILGSYADTSIVNATGVAAYSNYAVMTAQPGGLFTMDVRDPTLPAVMGSVSTPGDAIDLTISGQFAFVADGDSGLTVVHLVLRASPTIVGRFDTPGSVRGVSVAGGIAYLADGANGLVVIDVSDPSNPSYVGGLSLGGLAVGVEAWGQTVLVADATGALHMVDVTIPAAPILDSTVLLPGGPANVALFGGHALVPAGIGGMQVVRVSSPNSLIERVGNAAPPHSVFPADLAISGENAYIVDHYGLHVYDVSDPVAPYLVGTYHPPTSGYSESRIDVGGQIVCVASPALGLDLIDVSDPASPVRVGGVDDTQDDGFFKVVVSGRYAYTAGQAFGKDLRIVRITDPTAPVEVGSARIGNFSGPAEQHDMVVSGDYLYTASDVVFRVLDVSDRANPLNVSYDYNPWSVYNKIAGVSGKYVFCSTYDGSKDSLRVFDVSDPANPRAIETVPRSIPSPHTGITGEGIVTGTRLVFGHRYLGMEIFDVADPSGMLKIHDPLPLGGSHWMQIQGEYLYACGEFNEGLNVYNVYDRNFDTEDSAIRSAEIDETDDAIIRVKLTPTQQDSIRWELSADDGAHWQEVDPASGWNTVEYPGNVLLWRSSHATVEIQTNPACERLEIEWLFAHAVVDSVVETTGGPSDWIHLYFSPSGYDFLGAADPIATYEVRRVSDDAVLMTVFAQQTDGYAVRVPAPGGPTAESFYVAAYTAGGTRYDSPPESAMPSIVVGAEDEPATHAYALYQNTPNPFNPTTAIGYDVPVGGGAVTLEIFDVAGRLVRTLINGAKTEGRKSAVWDGRDNRGNYVASGVYIYRLRAPGFAESRKMTLLQ